MKAKRVLGPSSQSKELVFMSEKKENLDEQETVTSREDLVSALKSGHENSDVKKMLVAWMKAQEEVVNSAGGSFGTRAGLELKRFALYEDAKLDDANDAYKHLLMIAENEFSHGIYKKFVKMLKKILSKKSKNGFTDELYNEFVGESDNLYLKEIKRQNGVFSKILEKVRSAFNRILGKKGTESE